MKNNLLVLTRVMFGGDRRGDAVFLLGQRRVTHELLLLLVEHRCLVSAQVEICWLMVDVGVCSGDV